MSFVGGFLAGLIIPKDNGFAIALVEKFEDLVSILFLPLVSTILICSLPHCNTLCSISSYQVFAQILGY